VQLHATQYNGFQSLCIILFLFHEIRSFGVVPGASFKGTGVCGPQELRFFNVVRLPLFLHVSHMQMRDLTLTLT